MASPFVPPETTADIDTVSPPALLAWLAVRGWCLSVREDKLLVMYLGPFPDPPAPPDALAAVRQRKADVQAFLRADDQPTPAVTQVPPDRVRDLAADLAGTSRVGVEFTVRGYHGAQPTPYRADATRLVLAAPAGVFAVEPRLLDMPPLREALAGAEFIGWGPDCTKLGLLAAGLVRSHRPVTGLVPGAGLVVADDDQAVAVAARRAVAAFGGGMTNARHTDPVPGP